jgi:hypothetical protein
MEKKMSHLTYATSFQVVYANEAGVVYIAIMKKEIVLNLETALAQSYLR